jgi:TonB-dependent Receptor Plug Domain
MNIRMCNLVRLRALLAASAFFALTGASRVLAQAAPTPGAAADQTGTQAPASVATSTEDTEQQVVRMDPFTVTTETEGYKAVDTLGGARVQTKLVDTPSAISVITKSFLDDAGITNAQDLLVYTTNTEVAGLNGNFSGVASRGTGVSSNAEAGRLVNPNGTNRARGLSPMDNTRNYFSSEIPWDSYNIFRVDISRGPNSFLYGVGSPSGIANYSTNEAIFKDTGSIETRLGSFGTTRESLDFNKVLIPEELAMRIDLLNDDTQYQQKPAFNHSQRAYFALRYDPKALNSGSSHLKIQVNAEAGRVRSNNPRELPPMDFITGYFSGGGLNKAGYDPFIYNTNQQLTGVGSFSATGSTAPIQPALNPWINAQDYHYIWPGPAAAYWYDGKTGSLLQSMTTFNGAKDVNGANMSSFPQAAALYTTGFTNYAMTVNYRNPSLFPGAYAGTVTYNNKSLTDPSIFNFYDKLVDGPNKQEWQNWKAFNATIEETLLNGRIALQGVVDHQEFDQGQAGIFGYTEPFISVDLNANKIMYPSWYPNSVVANPNEGRPFLASDFGSGDNSTHYNHDNYQLTANGDLRSEDFLSKGLLTEILGHHSLTALVGQYDTQIEARSWSGYATDTAFANAMGDAAGVISANRTISWVSYIGPSLVSASSASGLNLSNIANAISPTSGTVLNFNNTWTATGVNPGDTWTDPSPFATNPSTQAENPANYRGWTTMPATVLNWKDNINQLYQSGNKTQQILKSAAFMYQGHLWDDMIIPEYGWRRDTITQRSSNAPLDPNTHVASMNYGITGSDVSFKTTSTSYGVTLHLPKSLRGKLPLGSDVSLYYFHGNNETPKVRYAFDTSLLPSEAGKTDDYGVQVDTLNGHATIRLTIFKTLDQNAQAGSGAADPLGNNGYYLYLLPAWGAADAAASGLEQTIPGGGGGFATNSGNVATQLAAVNDWKTNIAKYFPQTFFDSYGLGVNVASLQSGNYANVYNNPNTYPYPWVIANTGSGRINGSFPIVSQDIQSKGYELEVTVRPISNWDVTFNASKITAVQTALGSADSAFIEKEHEFFSGPAGQLPLWGYWGGAGGGTSTLYSYFMQNIWSAYQLQTAQTDTMQPELSKWNFKGITNYSFKNGMLKGFNVGGGVRWASKPILGYGISQYTDVLGNQTWIMDVHKPLYGKIEEHFDAWIGYQHKLTSKIDWRLQLNVRNVGEKPHLVPVSVEPDGSWAQMRIEEGQTFELTNKFMF